MLQDDTIARLRRIAAEVSDVQNHVPATQQNVLWNCRNAIIACAMAMQREGSGQRAAPPAVVA